MNTATRVEHRNELSVNENSSLGHAQVAPAVSRAEVTAAETWGMSAYARKMVVLTLLVGVLFLGSLGVYVWYGVQQFQKLP